MALSASIGRVIIILNQAAQKLTGYSAKEAIWRDADFNDL